MGLIRFSYLSTMLLIDLFDHTAAFNAIAYHMCVGPLFYFELWVKALRHTLRTCS